MECLAQSALMEAQAYRVETMAAKKCGLGANSDTYVSMPPKTYEDLYKQLNLMG